MAKAQVCKYCQSTNVVKHGVRAGIQRYLCNDCEHHFLDNNIHFPRMRVNHHVIVTALNLYYDGLSARKVANQLSNIYGENLSHTTVLSWIYKYSKLASAYVQSLQPQLSGKYHHDETELKVGGEGRYFWETIDEDTRFLVAHLLTNSRTTEDAKLVFKQAINKQRPTVLFTDGSFAYKDAYKKTMYSRWKARRVEWVKRVGIRARETNNIVERVHGTLKDRLKVARGLKKNATAKTWLDGYVINYNYCRVHSSIRQTPAQQAGIAVKGWKDLIQHAQVEKTKEEVAKKLMIEVKVKQ